MALILIALTLLSAASGQGTEDIYNQPPSTVKGCECKSACQTSVLFECNTAPFCEVVDKNCAGGQTAEWSVTHGYYDYCVYEPFGDYEQMPASRKKDLVMSHITADAGTKGTYPSALSVLGGIMGESVRVTFDASADVFPAKRTKYIHSVGVHGGIKFVSTGAHKYGGLFQGADHGIVRFSSAKEPGSGGVAPGMGVKFFRDGRPSANFVSMYSLDGQTCADKNFFAHDWSNHVHATDSFGLKLVAAKFWQASYCPAMVGLSDLASSRGGQGSFPWRLSFHALIDVDCPCTDYNQCLANFAKVTVGTKIFEVRAFADPKDTSPQLIGHIELTDPLVTSKFGDEKLFFSHQHMEDDFIIHPEWLKAIDRKAECGMGCAGTRAPPVSVGCSSPFHPGKDVSGMLTNDTITV